MKRAAHFITLFLFCLLLVACASNPVDPADMFKGQTAQQIFQDGQALMIKGKYDDAVKHFETLDIRYPFSPNAQQAQLDLIYCYYQQEDTASALAASDRYIQLYPRDSHVDYAYYMRGLIQFNENRGFFERHFKADFANRDLASLHGAYNDFNLLIRYFNKSPYAKDARQRMIYIRNLFASHQLQIAEFYYKRGVFVAAANRASEVVEHYQGAPVVPDALKLMVKSYEKLGLTQEAQAAQKLLTANFPSAK